MTKWEKVIQALELCIKGNEIHYCNKCPYKISDFNCDSKGFMKDALDLLKEQEPRVMTVEELRNDSGEAFYFETRAEMLRSCVIVNDTSNDFVYLVCGLDDDIYWRDYRSYNITWRCWTSRPTQEQRKTVPWEPPKEVKNA